MSAGSVAVAAAVMMAGPVSAQPQVAPPPVPTLREVVKEYQRLALPLPPPDAPLVRITIWLATDDPDRRPRRSHLLGFQLPPPWPGADPRYWCGSDFWADQWFDPRAVEPTDPTPAALDQVRMSGDDYLDLAVACRLRGWNQLADRLYHRSREFFYEMNRPSDEDEARPSDDEEEYRPLADLRDRAFFRWVKASPDPGADSLWAAGPVRALIDDAVDPLSAALGVLLAGPGPTQFRRAPPGSVEALIDGLTEYRDDLFGNSLPDDHEPYWRLAERGFDAIPALIDHVKDDRPTRAYFPGFNNFRPYRLTVGHLCSRLLYDLSGETIGGGYFDLRGDRLDPDEARKWFAAAKQVGEERWLLDHVLPKKDREPLGKVEQLAARILGAKYPARLAAVYRAILGRPSDPQASGWAKDFVPEVVASKLTREQKVALLEEGAGHDDIGHRVYALLGLAEVDPPGFRKNLLQTLRWLRDWQAVCLWFDNPHDLFALVERSGDPACWDALADLARAGSFELRMSLIFAAGRLEPPDKLDPLRRERVRLLAGFLDDRTAEAVGDDAWNWIEVRDHAAAQLAGVLRLPVRRNWEIVKADQELGPLSRLIFRETVRAAAERELARPAKP